MRPPGWLRRRRRSARAREATGGLHAFVVVRYSILTSDGTGYSLANQLDQDSYREQLFAASRLHAHERLFCGLTLPSLAGQQPPPDPSWFTLLVLTSTELPDAHRQTLDAALAPHPWAEVVALRPEAADVGQAVREEIRTRLAHRREPTTYLTTRLDDDDALSLAFFAHLWPYVIRDLVGFAISPAAGYAALVDEGAGRLEAVHELDYPKAAQGLSFVNRYDPAADAFAVPPASVFELGNHDKVDRRRPTILDARRRLYVRTFHQASTQHLLKGERHRKRYVRGEPVDLDDLAASFDLRALR